MASRICSTPQPEGVPNVSRLANADTPSESRSTSPTAVSSHDSLRPCPPTRKVTPVTKVSRMTDSELQTAPSPGMNAVPVRKRIDKFRETVNNSCSTNRYLSGLVDLAQLKCENARRRKDDLNKINYTQKRIREANKAYDAKDKECKETEMELRSLEVKRRRLYGELQPMETRNQELASQLELAKKQSGLSKVISHILEQDDPQQCLKEIANTFGWKLEPLCSSLKKEVIVKQERSIQEGVNSADDSSTIDSLTSQPQSQD